MLSTQLIIQNTQKNTFACFPALAAPSVDKIILHLKYIWQINF